MDSSTSMLLMGPFPVEGVSGWFLLLQYSREILGVNANSIDPDQTPHSVASYLGLRCLPMSVL